MDLALICTDYKPFPESGEMIKAAKTLGIPVFSETSSAKSNFHYGTCGFFLRYRDNDIFSEQEYLYDYSFILSIFHNKEVFNWDAKLMPAGQFSRYTTPIRKYFVRPNSGDKAFAGLVLDPNEVRTNLSFLFNINPWELIIVADSKDEPDEEYRFFCIKADNDDVKMVGCRYLPDASNDIPDYITKKAKEWAEQIFDKMTIGNSFVLDLFAYELDEENLNGDVYIGELNSWNSSGYYSINPTTLLEMILECYQ